MTVELESITLLAAQSNNINHRIRFVYPALAAVGDRLPVAGWDENDYGYIAAFACALEDGSLPLSALIGDPESGWNRGKAVVAQAIVVHIDNQWKLAAASNDEDLQSDVANDTAFLATIFGLPDKENLFAGA